MVDIVDKDGLPVILSDNDITCTIKGSAKLLGLEGGNNSDMTDYTDNVQRAFNGHLLAYIQSAGEGGKVTVTFTSPWLQPVTVTVDVK